MLVMKDEVKQILEIVTREQELNASRYQELKSSVDEIRSTMATKDELNKAFESLSEDINTFAGDHYKLKKRVDVIDKRLKKVEERLH